MSTLTSKDVVEILKACKRSGVVEFKYGELDVKFDLHANDEGQAVLVSKIPFEQESNPPVGFSEFKDEASGIESEDADLMLTDPEAWEREQMSTDSVKSEGVES